MSNSNNNSSDRDDQWHFTITTERTPREIIVDQLESLGLTGLAGRVDSLEMRVEEIESAIEGGLGGGSEPGITREEVIQIAEERGGLDPEKEERLDSALARTESALSELESKMARRVGPETPSGDYHTHSGWGLHFTTEQPYRFGKTTVEGLAEGVVNFELVQYNGSAGELVDETEVRIARGGEPVEIDLDLEAPEGEFLLTRDWVNPPGEEERVSLRRQTDYTGWDSDSGDGLTLHGSGHDEYSDNQHWYYVFDLGVRPSGGED